jgi:hypothetical protein
MTRRRWIPLTLIAAALALLAAATVWAATSAQEAEPAAPLAALGTAFTYQGQLKSDGEPVTGSCDMEFRLYEDAGGSSQVGPLLSLPVSVVEGFFTAELDFGSGALDGEARWLGIHLQCAGDPGMVDLGLQALTPTPYALSAPWSGLSGVPAGFADGIDNNTTYNAGTGLDLDHGFFSIEGVFRLPGGCSHGAPAEWSTKDNLWHCGIDGGWQPGKVILVAKSGGDYTSIQAAIDSLTTASAENPYLVWVAPGVYEEEVTMTPYVHLQGAGQEATIIRSDASVTLHLAGYNSLRDLTVLNFGADTYTSAIEASPSDTVTGTLVADVTARAESTGSWSQGIALRGSDTSVRLVDVTARGEGGSDYNLGLRVETGAGAILQGGSFTASGGEEASAISISASTGNTLEAAGVFALAENATAVTCGLQNAGTATLRGGSFAAHGSGDVRGISNLLSGAILEAESVTVEVRAATSMSTGLYNASGALATLRGGSFTARGGDIARGILNTGSGSVLQANGVAVLGADSAHNYGLYCDSAESTTVTLSLLEGSSKPVSCGAGTEITHSRLVGGPVSTSVTCVAVSRGTTFSAGPACP